ncbi:hypothetical protein R6Z07F_003600 [Ovis aries]
MLLWVHNPITSRKKTEEPYSHPVASKGERVETTSSHPRTVTRRWASLPPAPLAHRVAETLPKVTDEPQSSTRGARVHLQLKRRSFERGGIWLRALLSRAVLTPSGGSEYCSCADGCSSSVEAPGDPSPPCGFAGSQGATEAPAVLPLLRGRSLEGLRLGRRQAGSSQDGRHEARPQAWGTLGPREGALLEASQESRTLEPVGQRGGQDPPRPSVSRRQAAADRFIRASQATANPQSPPSNDHGHSDVLWCPP